MSLKALKKGEEVPEGARVYETIYLKKNGEKRVCKKYYIPKTGRRGRKKKNRTMCVDILKTLDEDCCLEVLEFLKQKFSNESDSESQ